MRLSSDFAKLSVNAQNFEMPVVASTVGPDGILISQMRNNDFVTLDPGFLTTAQCESKITFIDGDQSILRYRGYDIADLTSDGYYLDVAYLLIYGHLPNENQLSVFTERVLKNTVVGEDFHAFLNSFPRTAHPISVLASSINALETFLPSTNNIKDPEQVDEAIISILAKIRTITSQIMRRHRNQSLLYPNSADGYILDFFRMCFARPYENYEPDPTMVTALDRLLILQADHEQNCSTSVVRVVGSSNASLYASVASGINALSGPLHGGANEAAFKQLKVIRKYVEDGGTIQQFVDYAKREDKKIMGLGHRVYRSFDPRAQIAKEQAMNIYAAGKGNRELFDIAIELEQIVLADPYFTERKLYTNIDYWTALVYDAIGFESEMFTPLFAMARTAGWIAHWKEMHADPLTKIGRPRQVYSGPVYQEFKRVKER
ncbi:citrate synthase [Actinomycetota bacterium]|nr:citrate synthase [Actinomycetota bacterium]